MGTSRLEADVYVNGTLSMKTLVPSAGSISNSHMNAGAGLATSKMLHRHVINYNQMDGANIADTTGDGHPLHIVQGATATLISVQVACSDAPTGTGTVTVDIKRVNEDTPTVLATVLTGVITVDNSIADYEIVAGVLAVTALVAGDVLVAVVDETDGDGAPQGLQVTLVVDEAPA